jgi:hypothetical protein
MKKKLLSLLLVTLMAVSLAACGGSSESKKDDTEAAELNIDWDKCINDLKEGLQLSPDYTFVRDYYINFEDDQISITAAVDDATDPEKALDFADTLVRQLNLYAQNQDGNIKSASKDYYGGIYDHYNALIGVAPMSYTDDSSKWFVYDAITSGNGPKLNLTKEYE